MGKKKRKKRKARGSPKQTAKPVPFESSKRISDAGPETKPERKASNKLLGALLGFFLFLVAGLAVYMFLIPRARVKRDGNLNVLLVTLDTTRADRLGCYGYPRARTPNLDSLAAKGVRFRNAYCQVPLTTPSHCSILTGTYPLFHQVRNNGSYALSSDTETLAEILKAKGFETAAFVGSFTVDSRFGLDQGFDVYDDDFARGQAFKALSTERKAERVFEPFSRWLEESSGKPFFCWVHFFDPHLPYDPPSPFSVDFADIPYDGEIAYMDEQIGKMVEALRAKDLMSRTLIVLAGDHGEAFGEKGESGHGVFLYEGTLRVPLIFYAENHLPPGRVVGPRVRLIDVMPSILDLLDAPPGAKVQGTSLLPYVSGKKKEDLSTYIETYFPRENYGWSELVGVVDGEWKYIRAPKEELYSLKTDPEENRNVVGAEAKIAKQKRSELADLEARYASLAPSQRKELTSEEKEKLRSLGYISQATPASAGPLPDPKDMLEELRMNHQAETAELEGNLAGAAEVYEKMLSLRPDNPTSYVNLALVRAKMGNFDEAVRVLERGIERLPGSEVLLSRLAHTHMAMGRLQKALDAWQAVLVLNPRYFDGLLASGWILDLMGNKDQARVFFERALEVEPENTFLLKNYARNLGTTGRLKEAIEILEKLKTDNPEDHEVLQDLGIAYGQAGDIGRSIDYLKQAVAIHPTPLAYLNLAIGQRKAGQLEEAVNSLKLYLANPEGESEEKISAARQELFYLERQLKR